MPPPGPAPGKAVPLVKGPNIKPLPPFAPLPGSLSGPVLLQTGDDVSTDEILPAGAAILPLRSNIPEISKHTFSRLDESYYQRALPHRQSGSFVVGGANYGQGSGREHAAIAPRHLGLAAVLAKSFARIHRQDLINSGILPLTFAHAGDYDRIGRDDRLLIPDIVDRIEKGEKIRVRNETRNEAFELLLPLTDRERRTLLAGGLINLARKELAGNP